MFENQHAFDSRVKDGMGRMICIKCGFVLRLNTGDDIRECNNDDILTMGFLICH